MIPGRLIRLFDGLSVRNKILAGYGAVIAPFCALIIVAGVMSADMLGQSREIDENSIPALEMLEAVRSSGVAVIEATNTLALLSALGADTGALQNYANTDPAGVTATRTAFGQAVTAFAVFNDPDGGGDAIFRRNIAFAYRDIVQQSDRIAGRCIN